CYHRRAGGRTTRAYSQARRKINRGRLDDHCHAQRRAGGARTDADAGASDPPRTSQAAMTEKRIRQILDGVAAGSMTPGAAFKRIRELPFEDLGFAKLDSHRSIRRGIPEVVFGEGKTADQLAAIGRRVLASGTNLIITRLAADKARIVKRKIRARVYDVGVAGIHRLTANLEVIREASVLVVVAGMEGALPSVVAGLVDKPVIA